MNALLNPAAAPVTMTSLELVQFINNQRDVGAAELAHSDFLKKVPMVLGEVAGNFSSYYTASNGKQNPCYTFPKREACLMAMSYSYDLQAKVFDRMTALESAATPAIPNFANPADAARAWAAEYEARLLAENTKALQSQSANFEDNNDMFRAVLGKVDGMARDFAEVRHDMAESKGHLASIRDALNRRAP